VTGLAARRSAGFALRPARLGDVDALDALERDIFKGAHFAGHLISRSSFRRFVDSSTASLIIAELGGQLSGYALLLYRSNSIFARIYSIGVRVCFRRRGLARLLLTAAETDAIKRGRKAMKLETRADDRGAITLYEICGYRCTGRSPRYYGSVDALHFVKSLRKEPRRHS
jgi:[ribosomal protein S18]-alanine N-acetyltransferase